MNDAVKPNLLKPRWRKVFSDLWDDKTRTGLVVASIAAGVFAIGMIINAYVILGEDVNRSYAAVNSPNIKVWTDPFDAAFVRALEKVPGVETAQGRRMVSVRARRGAEDWQDLTLVGIADYPSPINRLVTLEGISSPGKNETVITQDIMHITGYHAGDNIEIELAVDSRHPLRVVGLVADQTTSTPDPNANNYAFVTLRTLEALGLNSDFNQLYITVAGDGKDSAFIAKVAAQVKDQVEDSGRKVYRQEEHLSNKHPMTDTMLAMLGLLGALGGLITILSSSLIINTLNGLLAQQLRQIGVMKLVGARSYQILGMYLTLIVIYSLIALALAAPLGALAGYALAWALAYMLGATLEGFRIIPVALVIQTLVAVLIPLSAGFFPVNSGAKTSVQQAISNYRPGNQSTQSSFFSRQAIWLKWISRPLLLSFRNTFRKRGRLLLTLFTLTMAGAVFIAVFNVRDSLSSLLDQVLQHFMGDVIVDFRHPYRVSEIQQTLLEIPGVSGVEGWTAAAGEIWNAHDDLVTNIAIVAPPQDTRLLNLELEAGRWLLPNEERAIVVANTIYKWYPNLKLGDSLRIKIPGRHVEDWTVVGIFPFFGMFGDPMAYANFEYVAAQNYLPNQATSYHLIIDVHAATAQHALAQRIERYLTDRNFAVQSIQTGYGMREKATMAVNTLLIFLLVMAVLTAFVGSIGLTGAMSINVLERTREIGVMRTIGAVDRAITQSVIIEALVIGLMTWVMAIGLSFPISFLLLQILGEAILGTAMALSFTPIGMLLWLAVVIVLSVFASLMPARNAARLTINEVLAYE